MIGGRLPFTVMMSEVSGAQDRLKYRKQEVCGCVEGEVGDRSISLAVYSVRPSFFLRDSGISGGGGRGRRK